MKKVIGGFGAISGATYPLRALGIFWRNPSLWSYMIVPIVLNLGIAIAIYSGLFFFGWGLINNFQTDFIAWLNSWLAQLPAWLAWLDYLAIGSIYLLRITLTVVALVVTGFAIAQFGVLLGAPWYGKLSEKLEQIRTGKIEIIEVSIFTDLGRALLYELKKLVLIAIIGLPLGIVSLFPGLGTSVFTIGWFILTTTIVGLDFIDSALERRRYKFRRKLKTFLAALPASGSFALVCVFLISIPLVNLVTIPLCVAAGTLLVCDRILRTTKPLK